MMSPYHTILVAYDGTDASGVALRQGAKLAQACEAQLHVLAIVVTSGGLLLDPTVVPSSLVLTEREFLLAAMTAAVEDLGENGRSVLTSVRDGEAAIEIVAYAHEIEADLVVIGHSAKSLFATWREGATGKHLMDHLPCSALIAIDEALKPSDSQGNSRRMAISHSTPPCACPAVVLQLPQGEEPSGVEHFNGAAQLHPPERNQPGPNGDSWLSLEQLISHVQTSKNDPGKQPWIKAGNIVLSPTDISDLHNFYRDHGTRK